MTNRQSEKLNAYNRLIVCRNQKIYAVITSVARSGMSRWVKFGVFYDSTYVRIDAAVATFLGMRWVEARGLQVRGCGMDVICHVLGYLNYAMCAYEHPDLTFEQRRTQFSGMDETYFTDANHYQRL